MESTTFVSWDQLSYKDQLLCTYSDMYKSVHGFRPTQHQVEYMTTLTETQLNAELDALEEYAAACFAEEQETEKKAIDNFEKIVAKLIADGANDRATAIRWLCQAHDIDDTDAMCYSFGLPYNYLGV